MNTADDKEIFFATALVNPRVRSAVRGHLKDVEWSSRMSERVAEYFMDLGDSQPYDRTVLHSHLVHEFMDTEILQILERCLGHLKTHKEDQHGVQSNELLMQFQKFYNRRVTTKLIRDFQHDPERLVEEIEKLQKMKFASLPIDVLGDLDVDKVIAEDLGNIRYIPSAFQAVIDSTEPHKGYSTGQVVCVCAPPGVGKSLYLAHEIVRIMRENVNIEEEKDKFKVYWLALGDMNRLDFIQRFTAIYKGIAINEVKKATKEHFNEEIKSAMKYVKISVVPAGYIDIHGARYFIENTVTDLEFDPQIVIIDYDANLMMNREMMYLSGEEVYNVASAIAKPVNRPGRLVFIASQPKIEFWNVCPMPKEAAAESSRKQAIIDMMITIARDPNCAKGTKVGKVLVAKNRRGIEGCECMYRLEGGIFFGMEDPNEYAASIVSTSDNNRKGGGQKYYGGGNRQRNTQQYG